MKVEYKICSSREDVRDFIDMSVKREDLINIVEHVASLAVINGNVWNEKVNFIVWYWDNCKVNDYDKENPYC
jgi:hypothetical protein